MLQHGAYTLLLDACYDRERFPTMDEAIEWTWASSPAEVEAVQFVLSRFFTLVDGVYLQARIQEELAEFEERSATNSRIARERETKRREKSTKRGQSVNDSPPDYHESPPTHYPLPTTQEPINKGKRKRKPPVERPEEVSEQTWTDWMALRETKRAPVTQTVITSAKREADKANMPLENFLQIWCARGSQGLEAAWLTDSERGRNRVESFYERDQRLKAEEMSKWAPGVAKKPINFANPFDFIDMEAPNVLAIEGD